jgi:hypothetical protein
VRGYLFGFLLGTSSRPPLTARGQLRNTFAGPGFCVGLSLLALGGYLIADQFENPFEAQSIGLLFAALLIATAITLLFCLLHPSWKSRYRVSVWPATASWEEKTVVIARRSTGRSNEHTDGGPLHGRYVDRARIRVSLNTIQARGIAGKYRSSRISR